MDLKNDHDLLIELNAKMDFIKLTLTDHIAYSNRLHGEHSTRISGLEQWKWRWGAWIAAMMFFLSLFGNIASRMMWH